MSIFLCNKILEDKQACNMNFDITESDRDFVKFEKLKDNFNWFYSNYEELKRDITINMQQLETKDKSIMITIQKDW